MTTCICGRPWPTNDAQGYAHRVAHGMDATIAEMDAGLAEIERERQLTRMATFIDGVFDALDETTALQAVKKEE